MPTARAREALEVRMSTVMRALADADDLTTNLLWDVHEEAGLPDAPAWFSPSERTVTINALFALQGDDPGRVNPLTPEGRRKHPHIIGLGCHEASHVRFTQWGETWKEAMDGVSPSVREIATLLEEPRIEKRYLSERPQDRTYLRAQSVLIDLTQFAPPSEEAREAMEEEGWVDGWRAGVLSILTLARGDAGVLEPEDIATPRRVLSLVLGDALDDLEALWREALDLEDGDIPGLLDVAKRWIEVVGEKPGGLGLIVVCPGEPPEPPEFADDMLDAPSEQTALVAMSGDLLSDLMSSLTQEIQEENDVEAEAQEDAESKAEEDQAERDRNVSDAKVQKQAQKKATEFFEDPGKSSKLRLVTQKERRDPTDAERQLAVRLTQEIKRARFRERDKIDVLSETPPGRLQGREAMLYTAQRSMRMQTTAKPFRTRLSRHTEEPPLTMGIMTDVSGSMASLMAFATALSWASASALKGIGKSLSVAYNKKITVLSEPGEFPSQPFPLEASGGGEDFKAAFSLVDGSLDLTTGRGVRLLFVISDGEYSPAQVSAARDAVQRLERGGAKVIWFAPERRGNRDLVGILGRKGQRRLVNVPQTYLSALSGGGGKRAVDQDTLVETVISEITSALRQGLKV